MTQADYAPVAERHGVSVKLISGLIQIESSGKPWAWNPEPRFHYFWDVRRDKAFRELSTEEIANKVPPSDFPAVGGDRDQEFWAQQASWGLMQVMGAVARSLGFKGIYLTELLDPLTNIEYGCRLLAQQLKWSEGDQRRALAAYNGGRMGNVQEPLRNGAYADKVLKAVEFA